MDLEDDSSISYGPLIRRTVERSPDNTILTPDIHTLVCGVVDIMLASQSIEHGDLRKSDAVNAPVRTTHFRCDGTSWCEVCLCDCYKGASYYGGLGIRA